jgi:uncharacterized protein YjbI with pentapeptide repeats
LNYASLPCRVVFDRCHFENSPAFEHSVLHGLDLRGCVLPDLWIQSAIVNGDLTLAGIRSIGEIAAQHLRVSGQVSMIGAQLSNEGGTALNLQGASIGGTAYLNGGFTATGTVNAPGIQVAGQLSMTGAQLSNPGGIALALPGASIGGTAYLNGGFTATGEVMALGIQVASQLSMAGAKLSNPEGIALNLEGASIGGAAFLDRGFTATGEVIASNIRTRQLSMRGAQVSNPGGIALGLQGASILADALLDDGFTASGGVRASGVQVARQFSMRGARLSNPDGDALSVDMARIGGFFLDNSSVFDGSTNFAFASIQILGVGSTSPDRGLPQLSDAQGWSIGTLEGFLQGDRKSAYMWLNTIQVHGHASHKGQFIAQPWHEIAKTYDHIGQPADGRWLRYQAAKKTTVVAPWTSKLWRWLYGALVGYGYYPVFVLLWMVLLWSIAFAASSSNASAFTPTAPTAAIATVSNTHGEREQIRTTGVSKTPSGYPPFQPSLFALDTALPAATTGQAAAWQLTGNTSILILFVFAAIRGASWILTALLLAGITGLLRKA